MEGGWEWEWEWGAPPTTAASSLWSWSSFSSVREAADPSEHGGFAESERGGSGDGEGGGGAASSPPLSLVGRSASAAVGSGMEGAAKGPAEVVQAALFSLCVRMGGESGDSGEEEEVVVVLDGTTWWREHDAPASSEGEGGWPFSW